MIYNKPFCSIIVLNYFGEKVIKKTIESLNELNYPKKLYEIIIVDNASKDKSRLILERLKKNYNNIKLIYLEKNLGFAGGNNPGMKEAKGKYVILLNNDCVVENNWLIELVKTAEKNKKIFAVGAKINLYPAFINIPFHFTTNQQIKKIAITKTNLLEFTNEKEMQITYSLFPNKCILKIPFDQSYDEIIEIDIESKHTEKNKFKNNIKIGSQFAKYIKDIKIKRNGKNVKYKISLILNKKLEKCYFSEIQNYGSLIFQDGYGRDIGAIVRYQSQNYEIDKNQYYIEVERYAACGASVLYRKSILNEIGYLDDNSFMYYEDVDICERARLYGYITVYNHKAVARHLHALSSKEWSPFFIYHTEKGRLLHVFYNFPLRIFFFEFFGFALKSVGQLLKGFKEIKKWSKNIQYIKISIYFLFNMPFLFLRRQQKHKFINKNAIEENYQKILEGYWYFN